MNGQTTLTSAEQIMEIHRLVAWTLRKISTEAPEADGPFSHTPITDMDVIQDFMQTLMVNHDWISKICGEYAARQWEQGEDREDNEFLQMLEQLMGGEMPCTHTQ